jgi:hypothetical protein
MMSSDILTVSSINLDEEEKMTALGGKTIGELE